MYKGLTVEIIRIIWNHGYYRSNPWLQKIHDEWFSFWVEWKTQLTMKDVDRQIQEMFLESEIDPPIFTEEVDGETLLGGNMELRAPWSNEKDTP